MYVQAVTSDLVENNQITFSSNFPQPFQNIPKVILSVQGFNFGIQSSQSYRLTIQSITLTSVTIKLQSIGTLIHKLNIGILAVDYPFVDVFTNTLDSSRLNAFHQVSNIIQSYITFYTSFQATVTTHLGFQLDSTQIDSQHIQVTASNFNGVTSIDYNLLVIYYDINNFPDYPFYAFYLKIFSDNIDSNTLVQTNLQSPDTGFYGLKDLSLIAISTFSIFFYPTSSSQIIQSGNYVFYTKKNYDFVNFANSQVIDFIKLSCPLNQYLYKQNCIQAPLPNGIYCLSSPNVCYDCNSNCKTCQSSSTNCLSCQSNQYLYQNKCYSSIQDGTYCINYICQQCALQCKTCLNTSDFCTSCFDYQYFYKNKCYASKPSQAFCILE
ncbi:hypothetical protein ABPG72_017446 [Tetrahymena utriculariae]